MPAGEVELPEFFQIMTMTKEAEAEATFWGDDFGADESISELFKSTELEETAPSRSGQDCVLETCRSQVLAARGAPQCVGEGAHAAHHGTHAALMKGCGLPRIPWPPQAALLIGTAPGHHAQ